MFALLWVDLLGFGMLRSVSIGFDWGLLYCFGVSFMFPVGLVGFGVGTGLGPCFGILRF